MKVSPSLINQSELIELTLDRNPLKMGSHVLLLDAIAYMGHSPKNNPFILESNSRVYDYSRFLETRRGFILVMEADRAIGILTARDVVQLIANKINLRGIKLSDILLPNPITVRLSQCHNVDVLQLFRQHHIRYLSIVDERGRSLGVIAKDSLRWHLQPIDLLRSRPILEVINRKVICASPQDSIQHLAELMAIHQVSSVIIVESNIPVGVITEHHILQLQNMARDRNQLMVQSQIEMGKPLLCLHHNQTIWDVYQTMQRHNNNQVIMVDESRILRGLVTQTNLLDGIGTRKIYSIVETLKSLVDRIEAEKFLVQQNQYSR